MDILGIDGVIYKGRLNSPGTNRTATMDKDFSCRGSALGHRMSSGQAVQSCECPTASAWDGAVPLCGKSISSLSSTCANSASASHLEAMKNLQTPTRQTTEKTVRIPKYGSHYVSPYSRECPSCVSPGPPALLHSPSLLLSAPGEAPRGVAGGAMPHARLSALQVPPCR